MSESLSPEARRRLLEEARALLAPDGAAETTGELLHGRYRLVRELGRGGMGVVYEAEDVALRRRVALKRLVLRPDAGPGLAESALREARAAARLDHPNLAAVYDVHEDAIVMQLGEGRPLNELPPASPRELAGWIRDAARAVHHAHEQGIVHRDLKPHNLMVSAGRVVVTDFGLAKELAVETSLSVSGSVLGTPAYMPPEQAGGRAREVDARSDVYALGATLYDRLAGRPPFTGKDLVALLRAVVEDEPTPLRALAPEVPPDLALVVHTCLAKEKGRRYASAAELADDLERWLDGRPVRAEAPSLGYRLAKALRRHRLAVAAAATLALVAGLAVGWNWTERRERRAIEDTLALVDELSVRLENARRLGTREAQAAGEARLDEGLALARAFLARHPEAYSVEALLGQLLRERGRPEEALAAFEHVLAARPDYTPARLARGLLRGALEREGRASGTDAAALEVLHRGALEDFAAVEASGAGRSLREADLRLARAERARLEGRAEEAERLWREATRLEPELAAPPALAALALARGDPDEAFRQAMSAVDLQRGFAPAYVALAPPATDEEAAARAIRQHERAAAGDEATLAIEGLVERFTDWAGRLADRKSTAAAYGQRAIGEVRRAAWLEREEQPTAALEALERALLDLGNALTIEPELHPALADRAAIERERARRLASEHPDQARAALSRSRADLARALELAPGSTRLRAERERGEGLAAELGLEAGADASLSGHEGGR